MIRDEHRKACPYGDPLCPCQDGDPCHYEGKNPMKPPVRYEHRKACIEAIEFALVGGDVPEWAMPIVRPQATAAFDALHGIALVIWVIDGDTGKRIIEPDDLTNPPERKA